MRFEFGFYSSILLITFSHGVIYSLLLLFKGFKTSNKSNYWLSLFVLLCSLYMSPWMLGFAGWYDNQPYRDILFYTPFQHLFFIGPVIFIYTQSLLNANYIFNRRQFLHLIPGILYLIYIGWIWIYDQFIFGGYYYYANQTDKDFDFWYQKLGLISMATYFILSLKYYNLYRKVIYDTTSYADSILFKWIKTYLIAFLIMLFLPIIFDGLALIYPDLNSYKGSWWFFLFFSVVMYYIAITGYSNPIINKIPFKVTNLSANNFLLLPESNNNKEIITDITYETLEENIVEEIDAWKIKIEHSILTEKLFKNPELTLSDVAYKLGTNISIISKAINQGFKMNFNDFINNYGIEEVKKALAANEHKNTTLLGIALNSGFNSKATFNRAFKKNTLLSPKEFMQKNNY